MNCLVALSNSWAYFNLRNTHSVISFNIMICSMINDNLIDSCNEIYPKIAKLSEFLWEPHG